jgi:serine/threonine-protein phosphatase 6 regulatory ankyrin repeat subunit B
LEQEGYKCNNDGFLSSIKDDKLVIIELYLEADIDINCSRDNGDTALSIASANGNKQIVDLLLQQKDIEVNKQTNYGDTALIIAARKGAYHVVESLLEHPNIEINHCNHKGHSALFEAKSGKYAKVTKLLIDHNADQKQVACKLIDEIGLEFSKETFLASVREGNDRVVAMFIDAGIDVNCVDKERNTALIIAAQKGWVSLVELLLKNGADKKRANKYGYTAYTYAVFKRDQQITSLLAIEVSAIPGIVRLFRAIEQADIEKVKKILEFIDTTTLKIPNPQGESPLELAIRFDNQETVELLLKKDQSLVNDRNADGKTALMYAAELNRVKIIHLLVDKYNAKIDEKTEEKGQTALMLAVWRGNSRAVKALIELGADVNAEDQNGRTALTAAILRGDLYIESMLRDKGAIKGDVLVDLIKYAYLGDVEGIKRSIKKGARPNVTDDSGNTPLMVAARRGWLEAVKALLDERGIDTNVSNHDGDSALILAACAGHVEIVEVLLNNGAKLDKRNKLGMTALMEAASGGKHLIVYYLLNKGSDPDLVADNGTTALLEACHQGSIEAVKILCEHKDKDDENIIKRYVNQNVRYGFTPLMTAMLAGHNEIVEKLKDYGANKGENEANLFLAARSGDAERIEQLGKIANVNALDKNGRTALMEAAGEGHLEAVETLLEYNAEAEVVSCDNTSVLQLAAEGGRVNVLKRLLPMVGENEKTTTSALVKAARKGHDEVVRLLLEESSANINGVHPRSVPLIAAATYNRLHVVRTFLAKGVDVNKQDSRKRTALSSAILNQNYEIASLLVENGAVEIGINDANLIVEAKNGNIGAVKRHLEMGANINTKDHGGKTALIWAADEGHNDIVSHLIKQDANIASKSNTGRTALLEACYKGHNNVVKILLGSLDPEDNEGVHEVVDARDNKGNTPLKEAWMRGYDRIVRILKKYGAQEGEREAKLLEAAATCKASVLEQSIRKNVSIETTNHRGMTPLMLASQSGCVDGVKILLNAGARINQQSNSGETSLILAANNGHKRIIDVLLEENAILDRTTRQGRTALIKAASSGHTDIVQALIKAGADVNRKDNYGKTALIIAAENQHLKVIKVLLKAGADINFVVPDGETVLMLAACSGDRNLVRILLELGADVNKKSNNGETALYFASREGHKGIVDDLLYKNADCNIATQTGRTPLIEACQAGRKDIVESLIKAGANVNQIDESRVSALMVAVKKGYQDIVKLLLDVDEIDHDISDKNGRTALTLSHLMKKNQYTGIFAGDLPESGDSFPVDIKKKVSSITSLLLEHGARDGWNSAELILATRTGEVDGIRQFAGESTVNVRDLEGKTSLLIACSNSDFSSVQLLLKAGATPNIQSQNGRTPLMEAARRGNLEIVKRLLNRFANVNVRDKEGNTALIESARSGSTEIITLLCEAGADIETWNNDGRTALMEAAKAGNINALDQLLKHIQQKKIQAESRLALICAMDREGYTALDLAKRGKHELCENILKKNDAEKCREINLVYVTPAGNRYHKLSCSYCRDAQEDGALKPFNISIAKIRGYLPCTACKPGFPAIKPGSASSLPGNGTTDAPVPCFPFKLQITRISEIEFRLRASGPSMGQPSASIKLPYDSDTLIAIQKLLENRGFEPDYFNETEKEALQKMGVLIDEQESTPRLKESWLKHIGKDLYQSLFPDIVEGSFREAYNETIAGERNTVSLQLRFDENAVEFARYPWELLHNDHRHLLTGGLVEFTRYITYGEPPASLECSPPLSLLFIGSHPQDLWPLPNDKERMAVWNNLQGLVEESKITLEKLDPPTYDELRDRTESQTYHIIHFDGHGVFAKRCHSCNKMNYPHTTSCYNCENSLKEVEPMGYIVFQNQEGKARFVKTKAMENILLGCNVKLVVLSACQSSVVQGKSVFSGVGPGLIHAGVPAVLAMQFSIPVDAAVHFAGGFYRALAKGDTINRAVALGRRQLWDREEYECAWFIPTLYLRCKQDNPVLLSV